MGLALLETRLTPTQRLHFRVTLCQAFEHIFQTPRIGDIPIRVFLQAFQLRQMFRHFTIRQRLTIASIVASRQRNKVIPHTPYDIQVIVQTLQGLIVKKFMCRVSHGLSSLKSLTPTQWVGRHATLR